MEQVAQAAQAETVYFIEVVTQDDEYFGSNLRLPRILHLRVIDPQGRKLVAQVGDFAGEPHTLYQTSQREGEPAQITFYARPIDDVAWNTLKLGDPERISVPVTQVQQSDLDEAFSGTLY